mmetsp:Transcript_16464/g.24184  ORF Transcript_16464/g.24184 Transcript_16464/m.24184 type:complete len:101 (-) Transcript_16464:75-377(-)
MFQIILETWVIKFTSDKTLGVKNCVGGVHSDLVFCSISDQPLCVSESHIARCGTVSLIIGNDLDTIILPYSYAAIGCTQINTDRFSINRGHGRIQTRRSI